MSTDSKKKKEKREKLEGLIAKRRAEGANEEDNDKLYFYSCFNYFKVKPFFFKTTIWVTIRVMSRKIIQYS